MKLKKIIAKEFLYFISTALLVTIVFAGLKLYNIYQERKITQITNDLKLLNSNYKKFLSRPLKVKNEKITQEKLYNFVNYVITNPNATKKNIYDNITELNNDSLLLQALYDYGATSQANKYEHKKEQNVKFPEFFIVNQSDTDSIQYFKTRIVPLENDILKTKSKFLTVDESRNYIIRIGLFLLIITFGVRYSYYATRWSILTIKSRE